jgi:hypothetical protein
MDPEGKTENVVRQRFIYSVSQKFPGERTKVSRSKCSLTASTNAGVTVLGLPLLFLSLTPPVSRKRLMRSHRSGDQVMSRRYGTHSLGTSDTHCTGQLVQLETTGHGFCTKQREVQVVTAARETGDNLHSSPNIIMLTPSRNMRWAGHAACMSK